MSTENILLFCSIVSAISTVVIAFYAFSSHILSRKIKQSNQKYENDMKSLISDLKISLLMVASTCRGASATKTLFEEYKKEIDPLE